MFELRKSNNTTVLVSTILEDLGFVNAFSTRLGGLSPFPQNSLNLGYSPADTEENVEENRKRFYSCLNINEYNLHTLKQIHSNASHLIDNKFFSNNSRETGDALYSNLPNILAGVFTADCLPVLLVDIKSGAYAAIHAGWRGTLKRIAEQTLAEMISHFGTNPINVHAVLGPNACGNCYEVGIELEEKFKLEFDYGKELFEIHSEENKLYLNVNLANRRQLENSGIPSNQIYSCGFCTIERNDLFFSYRLEHRNGPVGRLLSVIGKSK